VARSAKVEIWYFYAREIFPSSSLALDSGAAIVEGMVYVGSGDAGGTGATAGNVLLAFGIE